MTSLPIPSNAAVVGVQASCFVRMTAVRQMTGLGRSTIYRLMALHQFPWPVQLSTRAVGWRLSDLEQWSDARKIASHYAHDEQQKTTAPLIPAARAARWSVSHRSAAAGLMSNSSAANTPPGAEDHHLRRTR